MTAYVSYARVSTAQQGRSGLGLEAQQEAINAYLKPGGHAACSYLYRDRERQAQR
jgi:DNA invertase Pin-like site-specific DNA recombinase